MARQRLKELERISDKAVEVILSPQSIESIESQVLQILAEALGCEWGTYWKVDADRLLPTAHWSAPGVEARELDIDTSHRTLSMSEGTAGHVWRGRKPVWTRNLTEDMCLPRSLEAQSAGLQGGIWFAIKTDQAVYGVVELLGRNLPHASEELLVGIENLGIRIGYAIEDSHHKKFNESRVQAERL